MDNLFREKSYEVSRRSGEKMKNTHLLASMAMWLLAISASAVTAQDDTDDPTAADLKLLQGEWELFHGNEGIGAPTIRSVKEVVGNRETLRRFDIASGKMIHEHSVDFKLSQSGNVHVFTFYAVGGDPRNGGSFVYKVDEKNFWDIPGLLRGKEFRNYQLTPTIWHWTRVENKGKPKLSVVRQKLDKRIDIDFKRTPLQEAFAFVGNEIGVVIELDGDALKAAGFTKNMPQTMVSERITGLDAMGKLVENYQSPQRPEQSMVIVIDQGGKEVLVTTQAACDKLKLNSHKFKAD